MKENKIPQIADNYDKQNTYKKLCGRHTRAINNDFYFEAILIDYALIEDRLKSLLFYLGVLNDKNILKVNCKKTKTEIRQIYFSKYPDKTQIKLSNISTKLELIEALMTWCENNNPESGYLYYLKNACDNTIDYDEIRILLEKISEWCDYRNEIIHGALNKNISALEETMQKIEKYGFQYARQLDKYVKSLKSSNTIRKRMKMSLK